MSQFDRTLQRSMALGEQSPNLSTRADLDRWRASLALCQNCVTIPQGGAVKRSGTQRIVEALAGSKLYEFKYSRYDGYAIEAGALLMRFFRDFGYVESAPGVPLAINTPFTAPEALALSTAQSGDVMFIASGARAIQKLTRYGHASWGVLPAAFKNGPFLDDNAAEDKFLYTVDDTELLPGVSFVLKAFPESAAVFTAQNVGSLFLIREQDGRKYVKWQEDTNFAVGSFVRWGGNTYKLIRKGDDGDHTGFDPPVHLDGAEWDGADDGKGVLWKYCHSGWGIVQITGYTSGHQVQALVKSYVPADIVAEETINAGHVDAIEAPGGEYNAGGTNRWAEGAWSDRRGYPRVVVLHQQRLVAYSTPYEPAKYWASVTDDYENFLTGSDADLAFSRRVNAGEGISEILWALSASLGLVFGTTGPEMVTRTASNSANLKPDDVQDIPATEEGSAPIRARMLDAPVFVSADRQRFHRLVPDSDSNLPNAFKADDLTIFADHITESGIVDFTWQRDPYRLLWACRTDGTLIALTSRDDEGVRGWHRHPMTKGKVTALAAVASSSGVRQDLYLRVERALAAGTKTYIECLRPFFMREAEADRTATNGWFLDCAVRRTGAPVTTITGLADFNGETVRVLADGQSHGEKLVSGGAITLDRAASNVLVGLWMDARVRTLKYDRSFDGGATSGRKVRTPEPTAYLRESAVVSARAMHGDVTEVMIPTGGQTMNAPPTLFTGVAKASVAADWDRGGDCEFVSEGPFNMMIQAISPVTEVAQN